jgi:hypothetical protein
MVTTCCEHRCRRYPQHIVDGVSRLALIERHTLTKDKPFTQVHLHASARKDEQCSRVHGDPIKERTRAVNRFAHSACSRLDDRHHGRRPRLVRVSWYRTSKPASNSWLGLLHHRSVAGRPVLEFAKAGTGVGRCFEADVSYVNV